MKNFCFSLMLVLLCGGSFASDVNMTKADGLKMLRQIQILKAASAELATRQDVSILNDNIARLEKRARAGEDITASFEKYKVALEGKYELRFVAIEDRLSTLEHKHDEVEVRVSKLERRADATDANVASVSASVKTLAEVVGDLKNRPQQQSAPVYQTAAPAQYASQSNYSYPPLQQGQYYGTTPQGYGSSGLTYESVGFGQGGQCGGVVRVVRAIVRNCFGQVIENNCGGNYYGAGNNCHQPVCNQPPTCPNQPPHCLNGGGTPGGKHYH